jgi:hypothetical protein
MVSHAETVMTVAPKSSNRRYATSISRQWGNRMAARFQRAPNNRVS